MSDSHLADRIALWMRRHVSAAGARGLVVGLSGGIDSAVVARLCQLAVPESTLGVILPCHSDPQDERDAHLTAAAFGLPVVTIDLSGTFDTFVRAARAALSPADPRSGGDGEAIDRDLAARLPLANVKPRLRMTALYFVANRLNHLVAGTGNRSEIAIGYFTKHGDGGADLLPLGNLLKREVRALAKDLKVPQPIIDKPPSAGLWLGQTDEEEMGFSYSDLESYLEDGAEAVPPALAMRIERLVRTSSHKRSLPPVFRDEEMPEAARAGAE
jgi:NAD+ synthase